jgi:hypothetical protein
MFAALPKCSDVSFFASVFNGPLGAVHPFSWFELGVIQTFKVDKSYGFVKIKE